MENILAVANWFLAKKKISHLKLQKLCYYAEAWYCALYGKSLVNSDFLARVHGPVSPILYYRYKDYDNLDIIDEKIDGNPYLENVDINGFLEQIWSVYGEYEGTVLEEHTHKELPWQNARRGVDIYENSDNVISREDMKNYYTLINK